MKKISIIILFIVTSIKLMAIDVTVTNPNILRFDGWNDENHNELVHQFIIPIERDG